MMKRIMGAILAAVLFLSAAPLQAFAGVNADYVTQASQMSYIRTLTGMEDGEQTWHAGMKVSSAMNAYQLQLALDDLLDRQIDPMLKRMEELMGYSVQNGMEENPEFQQLLYDLTNVRNHAQTCRDIISSDRTAAYYQSMYLQQNDVFKNEHEREATAHSVIHWTNELKAKMNEVVEQYDDWYQLMDRVYNLLNKTEAAMDENDVALKRHITGLSASYMQMINRRAAEETAANQTDDKDFDITVVGKESALICVMADREVKESVIEGATVKYRYLDRDGNIVEGEPRVTDATGFVWFEHVSTDLCADDDGMFHIGYEVSCEGYRTQIVEWTLDQGGKIFYVILQKNVPGEDVYIAGMSLNGWDAMWNQVELRTTPANQVDQNIQFFMRSQSGGSFDGAVQMRYRQRGTGEDVTVETSFSEANPNPTFIGKWSALCAPGDDPKYPGSITFNLKGDEVNGDDTDTLELNTVEAAYDPDNYPETSSITGQMIYPGLTFDIPDDIPLLNKMSLCADFDMPFIAYFDIGGWWMVGASSYDMKWWDSLQKKSTHFQTTDQRERNDLIAKTVKETGKNAEQVANDVMMSDYKAKKKSFLGEAGMYWGFSVLLSGMAESSFFGTEEGEVTFVGSITGGSKGSWSKVFWPAPFPFPVTLGWGYSFSVTSTVETHVPYTAGEGRQEWSFDHAAGLRWTMDINLTFFLSVGGGVKWKVGIFVIEVGAGIKGTFGIKLSIPLKQPDWAHTESVKLTISIGVMIYVDAFIFHVYYQLVSAEFWCQDGKWDKKLVPFWGNSASGSFEQPAASASAFTYLNEDQEEKSEEHQTDLDGAIIWKYSQENTWGLTEPKFFNLGYWSGGYNLSRCYAMWIDEAANQIKWRTLVGNDANEEALTGTLKLSEETQKLLSNTNEDWKIVDFAVSSDQQMRTVAVPNWDDPWDEPSLTVTITLGMQAVVLGTDFDENGVPQRSRIECRPLIIEDGQLETMIVYDSRTEKTSDAVQAQEVDGSLMNVGVLFYAPSEYLTGIYDRERFCPVVCWSTNGGYYPLVIGNHSSGEACSVPTLDIPECIPFLNSAGTSITKMLMSDNQSTPCIAALDSNGNVLLLYPSNDFCPIVSDPILTGVSDIEMTTISNVWDGDKVTSEIALFCSMNVEQESVNEEDTEMMIKTPVKTVILKAADHDNLTVKSVSDLDVDSNGVKFYAGHFWNDTYIYWFDTKEGQTGENVGKILTRVRAMCYDPDRNLITNPYTLATLLPNEGADPTEPLPGYIRCFEQPINAQMVGLDQSNGGTLYFMRGWVNSRDEGETPDSTVVYTSYKAKCEKIARVSIIGADGCDPAVSAGGTCPMYFTALNDSNIPLLGYDIGIYQNDLLLESAHFDLTNADKCSVEFVDPRFGFAEGNSTFYGESAARRVGGLFDEINGDKWNVTREIYNNEGNHLTNTQTEYIELSVLLSEAIHTYSMTFGVPADWTSGVYTITVKPDKLYTIDRTSDIFETAFETANSEEAENVRVIAVGEEGAAVAGTLAGFEKVDFDHLKKGQLISEENGITPLQFESSEITIKRDIADLAIDYQLTKLNGEDIVILTVLQDGATNHPALRGVTVNAWVNDEEYPSFTHTFNTHHTDGRLAYNIAVPLTRMTNGRNAQRLRVAVSDTVKENREYSKYDNSHVFILGSSLRLIRQPENQIAMVGNDAIFSVEAAGGSGSYTYQWQRFNGKKWVDVQGETNATAIIPSVTESMNGGQVRCVVKDVDGNTVVSNAATLIVTQPIPPDTGDQTPVPMMLLAMTVSFCGVILLARKRKN